MMNFFKSCFSAKPHHDFADDMITKARNPHQRLVREGRTEEINLKETDLVPNMLEVKGAWNHRGETIDFGGTGHKQQKYN